MDSKENTLQEPEMRISSASTAPSATTVRPTSNHAFLPCAPGIRACSRRAQNTELLPIHLRPCQSALERSRGTCDLSSTSQVLLEARPYPCHPERSRGTCSFTFEHNESAGENANRRSLRYAALRSG